EFKPPRSIELHSRFIALNATMKAARELDAAKLYAGALYQYLEATRNFGMLDVVPPEGAKLDELRQSVAAMRQKIAASKDDHSILQIFVERAEAAQSKDELRSALVIVDHVAPAYYASRKAPAQAVRASGKTIQLTLVRWPYT